MRFRVCSGGFGILEDFFSRVISGVFSLGMEEVGDVEEERREDGETVGRGFWGIRVWVGNRRFYFCRMIVFI